MTERKNIPFTNEHFIAFCEKMLGQPYWFGTCLYKCAESLRERKSNQYKSHYGSSRTSRYRQDIAGKKICADCMGAAKGYAWTGGGQGVLESIGTGSSYKSAYGGNGCPDYGTSSMFDYAKKKNRPWGTIDTLPEVIGVAVHSGGHVGYYAGNGYAIEWRGFDYGCVKTKVAERNWTHWYCLPFINYGDADIDVPTPPENLERKLGDRTLRRGCNGTDVKSLQEALLKLKYSLPKYGADCKFGNETEKAVKAFQEKQGLKVDGVYGSKSHAELMRALEQASTVPSEPSKPPEPDNDIPPAPDDAEKPTVPDDTGSKKVQIVSKSGRVNIRKGNALTFARINSANDAMTFPWIATATNGWHAIKVHNVVGWVSPDFSKIV